MTDSTKKDEAYQALVNQYEQVAASLEVTDCARHELREALDRQLDRATELNRDLRRARTQLDEVGKRNQALAQMCDDLRSELAAALQRVEELEAKAAQAPPAEKPAARGRRTAEPAE
jgi:chromosome segregation ATPase